MGSFVVFFWSFGILLLLEYPLVVYIHIGSICHMLSPCDGINNYEPVYFVFPAHFKITVAGPSICCQLVF